MLQNDTSAPEAMDEALTGLFFAALPYRRVVFARGGWPELLPDPRPWQCYRRFLSHFWTASDLRRCEHRASSFLDERGAREALLFRRPGYPALLQRIYDPPPVLFLRGDPLHSGDLPVAVVGTRRPDAICLEAVDRLALQIQRSTSLQGLMRSCVLPPGIGDPPVQRAVQMLLFEEDVGRRADMPSDRPLPAASRRPAPLPGGPSPQSGHGAVRLVTVSGFARGVDERIHLASVRRAVPTVGVLGSGIDCITPAGNRYLLDEAVACGSPFTLLSEFFPDDPPRRFAYPRRNRIIAGLSPVVFVMQAGRGSGALITARYALEEGREVCAFDHPDLMGAGKNEGARSLLDDGAGRLVLFSLH